MNQHPARSSAKRFRQETVSFENLPDQSKLFLDFQSNADATAKFYPEKNTPLEDYAQRILSAYTVDRRELCDVLTEDNRVFGAGNRTFKNIELLRGEDCTAIVTGQQAGLFSGALYTIYKIVSAVKFAADLRERNIKAVPVFWIAEEDHDFDEVKKTFVPDKNGELLKLENAPENRLENAPVGLIKLDGTINQTIQKLFENLPTAEFTADAKRMLENAYQSGETYSAAFAKFIARLFEDYGLIIVAPLNPRLKKLCSPIFVAAIENSAEISLALLERNDELKRLNYQPQVLVEKDFYPFFLQSEAGERQPLRRNAESGRIKLQKSKREFEFAELSEIARRAPEQLSPNALMRPVVQDFLLPTLTYFGGAAEIAYFAQNQTIYKTLNRPVTPIRHRAAFTIVERKHARTLEKYESDFADLFAGKEAFAAGVVEKFLAQNAANTFDKVEEHISVQLDRLEQALDQDAPTLAANLTNRRKKILWHLSALRKKYHRAEIERNAVAERRIESLFAALLPENALQERTLNVAAFLNSYGENFIRWIYEAVETDETNHQILYL